MAGKLRALLYSRVSTLHDQRPEVQLGELRAFVGARGWETSYEIVDQGFSGGTDQRPGFKELMGLVRTRKVDVVVVVKMDRLFRSLKHLLLTLEEMNSMGVLFVALKDAVDYTTPQGKLFIGILGSLAEFEKSLIRERTLAGIEYARSHGKVLGRPTLHDPREINKLRSQGLSYRQIAKKMNCSTGVVSAAIRAERQSPLSSACQTQIETVAANEE